MAIQTAEHNMPRLSLVWPLTYISFSSNRGRFKSGPFYQLKIKVKLGVANFLVQQRVFFKFSSSSSPPSLSHSKSMAFMSGPCFCRCRWGWGHSKGLAVSGGWGGVWGRCRWGSACWMNSLRSGCCRLPDWTRSKNWKFISTKKRFLCFFRFLFEHGLDETLRYRKVRPFITLFM